MSSFSTDTRSMSSLPLVNSRVKNRRFKPAPNIDEPQFQFINTMELCAVDMMLHDSPDLIIPRTEIWAVWRPQVACMQESLEFLDAAVHWCTCAVQCAGALSCWNTTSLPDTLHRWSGKINYVFVGIISVCNSERIIKSDSICDSYAQMKKGPVFFDSQCICQTLYIAFVITQSEHANTYVYIQTRALSGWTAPLLLSKRLSLNLRKKSLKIKISKICSTVFVHW